MSRHVAADAPVSVERLHEVLVYDPCTGALTWRFSRSARAQAGQPAGTVNSRGYRRLIVDGRRMASQRVAWAMHYGEWPDPTKEVDHVNGDRSDERISNLRLATPSQNRRNTAVRGALPKGVRQSFRSTTFNAWIYVNRKPKYLGSFPTADEAAHAYNKAAIRLHGHYARLNPVGVAGQQQENGND